MNAHNDEKIIDTKAGLHKDVEHQEKAEIVEYTSAETNKVRWKLDLVFVAFCRVAKFC